MEIELDSWLFKNAPDCHGKMMPVIRGPWYCFVCYLCRKEIKICHA